MNNLSNLLQSKKQQGEIVHNWINTNYPDFFQFPADILTAESSKYFNSRKYSPDSKGLYSARQAIAKHNYSNTGDSEYNSNITENIIITSSTSESYNLIFKSVLQSGSILFPTPTYPLFEYICKFADIEPEYYHLNPANNFEIDFNSIHSALNNSHSKNIKAIVLITPNNPTGRVTTREELEELVSICAARNLYLIIDEVFDIFNYSYAPKDWNIWLEELLSKYPQVIVFRLNGISKSLALPDMKMAWIYVQAHHSSPRKILEVIEQMEIYNDTYLNANYLMQSIYPEIMNSQSVKDFQQSMIRSINSNRLHLIEQVKQSDIFSFVSEPNGGIHTILKVNVTDLPEEDFCLQLLSEKSIYAHPGYFYDISSEGRYIVVSFLGKIGNFF